MNSNYIREEDYPMTTQRRLSPAARFWLLYATLLAVAIGGFLWTQTASAAATGEWRVNLLKGSSTISTAKGATQDEAWAKCQALIPSSVTPTATYKCQTPSFVSVVTPDATCPPKPADQTQPGACPAGSTGSWTQTLTYTSAPPPTCWVAGEFLPTTPPTGACVVANRAPTISGTPASAVVAGQAYSYVPVAADADGDALTFTIASKPTWATFSATTGALTGTPTAANVGITSSIKITVSDGKLTAATPVFSITVTAAPSPPTGTGVLICSTSPYNQLFSACPSTSFGAPTGTQAVLFCPDVVTQGAARESCPSAIWYSWAGIQGFSVVLTDRGWYARQNIPTGPPPALTAPVLTSTRSANQVNPANSDVTLNWAAIAGATSYQLERCTGVSCTNFTALATVTAATYTNPNLPAGFSFSYRARAANAVGPGPYSNVRTEVTPTAPAPGTGSATISWTPPTKNTDGSTLTNLAGYRIEYGIVGIAGPALNKSIEIRNAGISSAIVPDLASGNWAFTVGAFNTAGAYSVQSSIVTKVVP